MIISTDAEKVADKIQLFHNNNMQQTRIERNLLYLNIIKITGEEPTANTIFNGENLKVDSLITGQDKDVHYHFCSRL